jgi:hypothetical protein
VMAYLRSTTTYLPSGVDRRRLSRILGTCPQKSPKHFVFFAPFYCYHLPARIAILVIVFIIVPPSRYASSPHPSPSISHPHRHHHQHRLSIVRFLSLSPTHNQLIDVHAYYLSIDATARSAHSYH